MEVSVLKARLAKLETFQEKLARLTFLAPAKEKEILALLREDAFMTTAEMALKLSVNRRIVQRELEKLKKKNPPYLT